MGVARRLGGWAAAVALAVLAVTIAAVLFSSERNMRLYGDGRGLAAPVDAIIVLGGGVDGDGLIGFSSRRRVRVGVALLRAGKARRLIFSGGPLGKAQFDVGRLMRDYAIKLGAPPGDLLAEEKSVSTFENLRYSFALAKARGLKRLAILTDAYHLERAEMLADFYGHPDIGLIAAPGLDRESLVDHSLAILRESLAWWYNVGKVAGWEALGAAGMPPAQRREWIR